MKKTLALILCLVLAMTALAGCGSKAPAETQPTNQPAQQPETPQPAEDQGPQEIENLKISFSPYADADVITASTAPLTELLQKTLLEKGYDVKNIDMTVGTNYAAVGEALSAGSADIGFMSSANYVVYSDDCDVLVTALRKALNKDSVDPADWNDGTVEAYNDGFSTYYRCIILAGDTEIGRQLGEKVNSGEKLTWEELDSATWAVLSPTSSSGYIYPCLWLLNNYDKGISDLSHVVEVDSHNSAVARLAAKQADIMVSYGHIRIKNAPLWNTDYAAEGNMAEVTNVIGVTDGIVNDLIAYSKTSELMQDEAFRTALEEAFIEIGATEEGKNIISVFSQVGYTHGTDSDYDTTRKAEALLKELKK